MHQPLYVFHSFFTHAAYVNGFTHFFCNAQAMIAERRIRLCELLSSGGSETNENLAAQLCDSSALWGSKLDK